MKFILKKKKNGKYTGKWIPESKDVWKWVINAMLVIWFVFVLYIIIWG